MRTKLTALLLCAAICLSLSSCSLMDQLRATFEPLMTPEKGISGADELEYSRLVSTDYTASYDRITPRYAYDTLGEGQRLLYEGLCENAYSISSDSDDSGYPTPQVIVDGYCLTEAELAVAVSAFCCDNPAVFWTAESYSYLVDEDAGYTALRLYSLYSPDEVAAMQEELDDVLTAFYDSVPEGLTNYEREKRVHDYLIETCDYDTADSDTTYLDAETLKSHSVYGALVDRLCVCEGYGTAMQLLLNGLGVECITLTGDAYNSSAKESESEKVLHLWNAVKLDDGCWYHVDPTWDDQESALQQYDYFNLDDESIFADHTLSLTFDQLSEDAINENGTEDMNFFIPKCAATDYNYYAYELPRLTGYDASMLDESLYQSAISGDEYYSFYVEPNLDYDAALAALFQEEQTFFERIGRVNDRLEDVELDRSNVFYYLNEPRRTIAVKLHYL